MEVIKIRKLFCIVESLFASQSWRSPPTPISNSVLFLHVARCCGHALSQDFVRADVHSALRLAYSRLLNLFVMVEDQLHGVL